MCDPSVCLSVPLEIYHIQRIRSITVVCTISLLHTHDDCCHDQQAHTSFFHRGQSKKPPPMLFQRKPVIVSCSHPQRKHALSEIIIAHSVWETTTTTTRRDDAIPAMPKNLPYRLLRFIEHTHTEPKATPGITSNNTEWPD